MNMKSSSDDIYLYGSVYLIVKFTLYTLFIICDLCIFKS